MAKIPRYYVDTSVLGGCFDEEFADASQSQMASVRSGRVLLLVSPILLAELQGAPAEVQAMLDDLPASQVEGVGLAEESFRLRDAYLADGVVTAKWRDDAHHVALATVARADLIVSWNFRHLVNVIRIRGFNAVNLRLGYQTIDIRSPREVTWCEDEEL